MLVCISLFIQENLKRHLMEQGYENLSMKYYKYESITISMKVVYDVKRMKSWQLMKSFVTLLSKNLVNVQEIADNSLYRIIPVENMSFLFCSTLPTRTVRA